MYTLVETYDDSNGKFSQIFGNVAIIDCYYFFFNILDAVEERVNEMPFSRERFEYKALIEAVRIELDETGFSICELPYEIDGVLNDQATYYLDKYKEI